MHRRSHGHTLFSLMSPQKKHTRKVCCTRSLFIVTPAIPRSWMQMWTNVCDCVRKNDTKRRITEHRTNPGTVQHPTPNHRYASSLWPDHLLDMFMVFNFIGESPREFMLSNNPIRQSRLSVSYMKSPCMYVRLRWWVAQLHIKRLHIKRTHAQPYTLIQVMQAPLDSSPTGTHNIMALNKSIRG